MQADRQRGAWHARLRTVRRHWLFGTLFAVGAGLRVVTQLAYRPALIFYDSPGYLLNATDLSPRQDRPMGYPLLLRPILDVGTLDWVTAVQHVLGLLAAVVVYLTVLRFGMPPWLAALAAAPMLLDGYQLNIEQWIMSDTLFEFLLVAAFALLLWRRTPTLPACLVAAALLSFGVWVRLAGAAMIVPAVVVILCATPTWRRRVLYAVLSLAVFTAPLIGYASWFDAKWGRFAMSDTTARFLYARVATFADCSAIHPPADERALCPSTVPGGERLPTNCYAWCSESPYASFTAPRGKNKDALVKEFAQKAILHQPFDYLEAVCADFVHGFEPGRPIDGLDGGFGYWRFTVHYPNSAPTGAPAAQARAFDSAVPSTNRTLSRFLVDYQAVVYAPGPLLALGLLIGLIAAAGAGRARSSGLRIACLGLCLAGLAATFSAYVTSEFDWRYQLPLLFLYWPAGIIGMCGVTGRPNRSPGETTERVAVPTGINCKPGDRASRTGPIQTE